MATSLSFGDVREVWFATLDDPDTKFSFLIRDDAFSKSGAVFGRTVRLGDPLNTGPGSGWRQTSWEGGSLQRVWKDQAMFQEGSADVWSRVGRIRMWPGWSHIHKDATRKFDSFVMGTGNDGPAIGNTKLYVGERDYYYVAAAPSAGYKAYKYDPDTNTWTTLPLTPTSIGRGYTAIVAASDDGATSQFIYFGTGGGIWVYSETGNTWAKDSGATYPINNDSLVCFRDATYYTSGTSLVKRTPAAGGFGIVGTHTILKTHTSCYVAQGLAVWNNRLWYGLNYQGNRAMLGTSDGVTAQSVLEFPEEFFINKIVSHYGALYIFGGKPQAVAGSAAHPAAISMVWKYTGSSLTKLWESNDEDHHASTDGKPHIATSATTFGPLLVWVNPGFDGTVTPRPGLMMYDAEKDALFEGPSFTTDLSGITDGFAPTCVHAFDNTLAVAYHDFHDYTKNGATGVDFANGVAYLRFPNFMRDKNLRLPTTFKGRSVEQAFSQQEKMQFLVSSRYVGDDSVSAETKTWLSGKVICRVPQNTQLKVYIITNEKQAYLVKTVTGSVAKADWHTETFPLKNPGSYNTFDPLSSTVTLTADAANTGKYLQSATVQYRLELSSLDQGTTSTATPEVDAVEIGWMVAPTKRRQWHMRFVMQDDQPRLTEVANPVTTAQAMADVLEGLWSESLPFRMWGPFAEAVDPTTLDSSNCVEVVPTPESYNNQQYRIESDDDAVAQETGLTLIENVTS